jgi:sterol desaturase/sphingolipid hydroxylase (fatty acid hydroxylase superfamily)
MMCWDSCKDWQLLRSPFFFLLLAQTTQFLGCCIYSAYDYHQKRPLPRISPTACLGFLPFLAMWAFGTFPYERELPTLAPTPMMFIAQLVICGITGDLLHYWTHRFLHSNVTLRQRIHYVHHANPLPLHSWVGMQVHPVEVVMITFAIYSPFLLFAHPLVLWVFTVLATINATVAHSGYEEGGFVSLFVPFALNAKDHQTHHELNSTKNYGNILRTWDTLFNTYGGETTVQKRE